MTDKLIEVKCFSVNDGDNTAKIDPAQLRKHGYYKLDEVVIDEDKVSSIISDWNKNPKGVALSYRIYANNPITLKESEVGK